MAELSDFERLPGTEKGWLSCEEVSDRKKVSLLQRNYVICIAKCDFEDTLIVMLNNGSFLEKTYKTASELDLDLRVLVYNLGYTYKPELLDSEE